MARAYRRISSTYAARGKLLADAPEDRFGAAMEVSRPDGGLQLVARLSGIQAEDRAMAALGAAGFAVAALSRYGCGVPGPPGLVIGFADAEPALVARFCTALAAAVR
jgi:GntR family transcriptional regulator/MocR family aminotransferase